MKEGLKPMKKSGPTQEELEELREMRKEISTLFRSNARYSIILCKKYLEFSQKYNSAMDQAESFYYSGMCHNFIGENVKALHLYNLSKESNIMQDSDLDYRINISMGVSFRQIGNFKEALKSYTNALNSEFKDRLDVVYNNIAVIFYHLNELDNAIVYSYKAYALFCSNNDVVNSLGILNNIGRILTLQNRFSEAEQSIKAAKKIAISNNFVNQIVISQHYLGYLYFCQKKFEKSLHVLQNALSSATKIQNKSQLYSIKLLIAQVYGSLGKTSEAKESFKEAIRLSVGENFNERLNCIKLFYLYLGELKEYKLAIYYLKISKKVAYKKSLTEKSADLLKVRVFFEQKEFDLKLESLGTLNTLNERLKLKSLKLEFNNDRLQSAVRILTESQLLRTQMNPHFIYNTLNSISALIKNKKNDRANQYLLMFSKLTRDVYHHSRLEKITLLEELRIVKYYIEMELLRFDNSFDYKINIDKNIDPKENLIPPMVIQPIVENALKHGIFHLDRSIKGNLVINIVSENLLRRNHKLMKIEVVDNGIGLNLRTDFLETFNHESALFITKKRLQNYNISCKLNKSITYHGREFGGCIFTLFIVNKTPNDFYSQSE
jgi:tetratricopeptide (TPR) repeat protein